jgi:hypothetical protein
MRQLKQEECYEKRDSHSMLLTPQFFKEQSRLTTQSLINLISHGFNITSIGDLMNVITEPFKALTKQRQPKSMERPKCFNGEEVTIFHHHLLPLMMKDIQGLLLNISIYPLMLSHAQSH